MNARIGLALVVLVAAGVLAAKLAASSDDEPTGDVATTSSFDFGDVADRPLLTRTFPFPGDGSRIVTKSWTTCACTAISVVKGADGSRLVELGADVTEHSGRREYVGYLTLDDGTTHAFELKVHLLSPLRVSPQFVHIVVASGEVEGRCGARLEGTAPKDSVVRIDTGSRAVVAEVGAPQETEWGLLRIPIDIRASLPPDRAYEWISLSLDVQAGASKSVLVLPGIVERRQRLRLSPGRVVLDAARAARGELVGRAFVRSDEMTGDELVGGLRAVENRDFLRVATSRAGPGGVLVEFALAEPWTKQRRTLRLRCGDEPPIELSVFVKNAGG